MAQSGNWIGNLINWIIGYIIMYIWQIFIPLLGLFGLWQMPLDAMLGVYESFAPSDVSDIYTSDMPYGG